MSKQDLVLITGPVSQNEMPGAVIPGSKVLHLGCLGNRPPLCPSLGEQLKGDPSSLLIKARLTQSELGDLVLMGFSAGGSLIKRLLTNLDYRRLTTAVMLADATYTSTWDDAKNRVPPTMPGFDDYCVDVVNGSGQQLFVSTASINPNNVWASGIENIQRLRKEIERRTGRTFRRLDHFFGVTNPRGDTPQAVYKLGNVIFAEFSGSSDFGHGQYAIQPQIWKRILLPWLEQGKGTISSSEELSTSIFSGSWRYLALPIGAASGFGLTRWYLKR